MDEQEWQAPPLNWFGGYLVARHLLAYTKANVDDADRDSFLAKLNRVNFIARVNVIMGVLNTYGPSLEAAQAIQAGGQGFFTDLTAEVLADKLAEAVQAVSNPDAVWKFRAGEFGSLDFSDVPGEAPGGGGCNDPNCPGCGGG